MESVLIVVIVRIDQIKPGTDTTPATFNLTQTDLSIFHVCFLLLQLCKENFDSCHIYTGPN